MSTSGLKIPYIIVAVGAILLIPLIAMQFTDEVNWTLMDFVIASILLFGTGLLVNLVINKTSNSKYRTGLIMAILMALLLVWAALAVGIFDFV